MIDLSSENKLFDIPALNRFRIGDHVVADATADWDRFEGIIVEIELQRQYASSRLQPSITLLHDGCLTDGFLPDQLRKIAPDASAELSAADLLMIARQEQSVANLSGIDEAMDFMRGVVDWISKAIDRRAAESSRTDLRKRIAAAIFDPGATEGRKGDRDLTTWQTDAVMHALGVATTSEGKNNG